ncbi:hypothetical protein BCEN4_770007 [Burkholderia cenocepacia]|nr:hypothetical protein BCEN4_770007 [Burkholderia cenocepacia]
MPLKGFLMISKLVSHGLQALT